MGKFYLIIITLMRMAVVSSAINMLAVFGGLETRVGFVVTSAFSVMAYGVQGATSPVFLPGS